jgi:5-methylcytosine-specific restriction endonuclease McrA
MVHVRVDHAALLRGHVESREVCELPGIGPIPVEVARSLAVDSILSVLVTDGVDVTTVAHAGRTIPAALRRALLERDQHCAVPGCDVREALEIDHIRPVGQGGETTLANLVCLCHWHHYLKTHQGHAIERSVGGWRWLAPDEIGGSPPRPARRSINRRSSG